MSHLYWLLGYAQGVDCSARVCGQRIMVCCFFQTRMFVSAENICRKQTCEMWRAQYWFCFVRFIYVLTIHAGAVWDDETPCLICTVSTTWLNQCAIRVFTLLTVGSTWNHEYSRKCFVYIYIPCGFVSDCPRLRQNKKTQSRSNSSGFTLTVVFECFWQHHCDHKPRSRKYIRTQTHTHTHQKNNMVLGQF